jgi:crotonobetainyl-CoA:carnitine CoA-transferase CaiB-like acyl-CoA transferase
MGCPEYAARQNDPSARAEIRERLQGIFVTQPLDHWLTLLGDAETQFAPISSIAEALADPHNIARGMAIDVPIDGGAIRQIGSPIKLSETAAVAPRAAGPAGADTDAILKEIGLSL